MEKERVKKIITTKVKKEIGSKSIKQKQSKRKKKILKENEKNPKRYRFIVQISSLL
jgi:hypothetical protein